MNTKVKRKSRKQKAKGRKLRKLGVTPMEFVPDIIAKSLQYYHLFGIVTPQQQETGYW